jgi:acid phosphatase
MSRRVVCGSVVVALALISPSIASAASQTFAVTADSYVSPAAPTSNYASSTRLWVGGSPAMTTYLSFNVQLPAGATITGARLELYVGSGSTVAGYQAYGVADTTWGESTITYANAPPFRALLGSSGGWATNGYKTASLSAGYIHNGVNSIGVATSGIAAKSFWSREAGANVPELVVDYAPAYPLRGMYMRDLSSTGFSDEAANGFNLIDSAPGTADYLTGNLQGLVWVGNYNNTTCSWSVSDSTLASYVTAHKGDPKIAAWYISDEPDPVACPNAPAQHQARTALIHSIDPTAKVYVLLDSNSGQASLDEMADWVGTADVFGLNPFTCYQDQSSCVYSWIDTVAARADQLGLPYWGVVQAFGDPPGSGYTYTSLDGSGNPVSGHVQLPSANELDQEFVHWRATKMQDYLVYAWRSPSSTPSLWLANQPPLLAQLLSENGMNPPDTSPPSMPTKLVATNAAGTSISVKWNTSTDNVGVSGYGIYQGGALVDSVAGTSASYTFSGLTCGTTYQLGVDAFDAAGNRSPISTLTVQTLICPAPPPPTTTPHIMVIAEENHSYSEIVGNPSLPYINGLINQYGSATNWSALSHPSEPNYLGLVSGSIWDNPPDYTPQQETYAGPTVVDQLANAGIGWKAYMEDMRTACDLTDTYSPGYYDVNHNPFMYFDTIRNNPAQCNRDVPFTQFATDLANNTAPPFIFVSPNTMDDMHDGTYAQADSWLENTMSEVLASQWYAQGGIVIVTWDEGSSSNQVATIVVAQNNAGKQLSAAGNHYGILRAIEEAYGLPLLGHAADTTVGDLTPLF